MEGMELTVVDNAEKSRFEARTPQGGAAGWVEYTRTTDSVTLDHTEVDADFEGQGVASTVVKQTLRMLLDEGVTVVNDCPFIERYMARHTGEYDDVVRQAEG